VLAGSQVEARVHSRRGFRALPLFVDVGPNTKMGLFRLSISEVETVFYGGRNGTSTPSGGDGSRSSRSGMTGETGVGEKDIPFGSRKSSTTSNSITGGPLSTSGVDGAGGSDEGSTFTFVFRRTSKGYSGYPSCNGKFDVLIPSEQAVTAVKLVLVEATRKGEGSPVPPQNGTISLSEFHPSLDWGKVAGFRYLGEVKNKLGRTQGWWRCPSANVKEGSSQYKGEEAGPKWWCFKRSAAGEGVAESTAAKRCSIMRALGSSESLFGHNGSSVPSSPSSTVSSSSLPSPQVSAPASLTRPFIVVPEAPSKWEARDGMECLRTIAPALDDGSGLFLDAEWEVVGTHVSGKGDDGRRERESEHECGKKSESEEEEKKEKVKVKETSARWKFEQKQLERKESGTEGSGRGETAIVTRLERGFSWVALVGDSRPNDIWMMIVQLVGHIPAGNEPATIALRRELETRQYWFPSSPSPPSASSPSASPSSSPSTAPRAYAPPSVGRYPFPPSFESEDLLVRCLSPEDGRVLSDEEVMKMTAVEFSAVAYLKKIDLGLFYYRWEGTSTSEKVLRQLRNTLEGVRKGVFGGQSPQSIAFGLSTHPAIHLMKTSLASVGTGIAALDAWLAEYMAHVHREDVERGGVKGREAGVKGVDSTSVLNRRTEKEEERGDSSETALEGQADLAGWSSSATKVVWMEGLPSNLLYNTMKLHCSTSTNIFLCNMASLKALCDGAIERSKVSGFLPRSDEGREGDSENQRESEGERKVGGRESAREVGNHRESGGKRLMEKRTHYHYKLSVADYWNYFFRVRLDCSKEKDPAHYRQNNCLGWQSLLLLRDLLEK